ncbi:hypothetical protein BGW36DRAFT_398853 [Talaromyces proteolyticus]|uniref:RRM domain-containing protein n=1 Tax=Talaromyces proteolyticus TaxID=1131652 RepID=A0AAD4KNT6_9EURO|nr:uncharacterized protein BGW36DRAFT_398853 [Talaromyces proteolyticus]KAH8693528.1 hypothetical protein BGW36DRAFT_398853 [Talaromyces proteolyticus]
MSTKIVSRNGPSGGKGGGAPNQTLYIKNLPDKVKKSDVRLLLYTLFSTYGPVLDVVVMRTAKMRGQGHVVFRDVQASTQAMRALQGFDFCGKELAIAYAKGSSDVINKLRGTYVAPTTGANAPGAVSTDLQKSIFSAPPSAATAGIKRPREEESDEGEAPMDEDDSDVPMEASSDED